MFYTRRSTHKQKLNILRWTSAVRFQVAGCRSRSKGRALYRSRCIAGRIRARHASFKQGRIQDLLQGGAKYTARVSAREILCATPTFDVVFKVVA